MDHQQFPAISVGPEVLRDFGAASRREWLCANGIGGYASGSLSGAGTRGYHSLLTVALSPPVRRMACVARCEATVVTSAGEYELAANQYPGAVHPRGFEHLLDYSAWPCPTFRYAAGGLELRQRIWMAHGSNTTYVTWSSAGPGHAVLRLAPMVCWRDHHALMREDPAFPAGMEILGSELRIRPDGCGAVIRILATQGDWKPAGWWHRQVEYARELERGLAGREDLYCPAVLEVRLEAGCQVAMAFTIEDRVEGPAPAWQRHVSRLENCLASAGEAPDDVDRALTLAADTFLVGAGETAQACRPSVIAGYPWFGDWGRDTMISLPGLCAGDPGTAHAILDAYGRSMRHGLIPNRFPDAGEEPEYNTADATLWMLAVAGRTPGAGLSSEHAMLSVQAHMIGTLNEIRMDPLDGLLVAGAADSQLTWMDARVDGFPVTPRTGKPVEINALWCSALVAAARIAPTTELAARLAAAAARAQEAFTRTFVRTDGTGLWDCVGLGGADGAVRPNQLIAAAVLADAIPLEARRAAVETALRELWMGPAVRTLSPLDSRYRGRYEGGPAERDRAYHQGTAWPWLLGPLAQAHFGVYGNSRAALALLADAEGHLMGEGGGWLPEIFPGGGGLQAGCPAQAWSIAEVRRVRRELQRDEPFAPQDAAQ